MRVLGEKKHLFRATSLKLRQAVVVTVETATMATEVPAKKLRLSGEQSEQGMESKQEVPRILKLDISKYSESIQEMTNEELLQIFNIGVVVKESFTLSFLENNSVFREELGKQLNPIRKEIKNLPLTVADIEMRISDSVNAMEMRTGHRMEAIAGKIDGLAQGFQKPVTKGVLGEKMVLSTLKKNLLNHSFQDVANELEIRGDIRVSSPEGREFMIEVKNHAKNVPKKEIDKFKDDLRLSKEVKVGIMLSLQSGIAMKSKKGKFEVNHVDGKYLIYVPNALEQPEVMIWSVFLATELAGLDVEIKDNQAQKLQNLCECFKEKMKYVKTCRDRIVTLNNAIKGLEESIEPIFEIIQDAEKKLKAILKDSSQNARYSPQPAQT